MNLKDKFVIGVLGGMGTYATIHLFRQYAEVFPAVKEWERPRIIIDNNCTMPSRVRAILYNENVDVLVEQMTNSIKFLMDAGATRILLACNTSHLFLEKIYEKLPEARNRVVNIIQNCADQLSLQGVQKVYLLATEGTIQSKIYEKIFAKNHIDLLTPTIEDFATLRNFIEVVKQNDYPQDIGKLFSEFVINKLMESLADTLILGCTELPILYEKCTFEVKNVSVYDPLLMALKKIKSEFDML